jgi:hypothetical protein
MKITRYIEKRNLDHVLDFEKNFDCKGGVYLFRTKEYMKKFPGYGWHKVEMNITKVK